MLCQHELAPSYLLLLLLLLIHMIYEDEDMIYEESFLMSGAASAQVHVHPLLLLCFMCSSKHQWTLCTLEVQAVCLMVH
jgi:hypothetical protein